MLSNILKIGAEGRHVILVEDIVDTGLTLKALIDELSTCAESVKVVALLNKKSRRTVDVQPDYCAFECPDEFVVGYGMDFNEQYRSLPYIGVLRPQVYGAPDD
ncbi:unnamed protein product [Ostreobium quekettii]|uniref:Phosphoribosyltransferase domain-containing protein n=1 Tax=Ostreobium quekettii TaxID=121088 RepID=A0A8S1J4G7_9CHLO|nr:unnamed protein product [Ostreobium quekettii]|eukprot:evm.model.scf_760EXC.4 EVM.evm.TU.scf_760EXC.4   scf_760EXC:41049-43046(+)